MYYKLIQFFVYAEEKDVCAVTESSGNVIEVRENMECIIRDDAYLSSNTVTALQKERFVF